MGIKIITRRIDARMVTIKMVDGSLILGKINVLNAGEGDQRVSDIFTKTSEPFVVVFDSTAEGKSGQVLVINKRNISWVSPMDAPPGPDRQKDEKPEEP